MKHYSGLFAMFGIAAVCIGLTAYLQRTAFVNPPQPKVIWAEVVCSECEGDGQVEGQACKFCKDGLMEWKDGKIIKCVLCNGTGKRIGGCPYCGGSGKMQEEQRTKKGR